MSSMSVPLQRRLAARGATVVVIAVLIGACNALGGSPTAPPQPTSGPMGGNPAPSKTPALTPFEPVASRAISDPNALNQVVLDLGDARHALSIHMATTAGTATLTIEVSVDSLNWITIDTIGAAAAIAKFYSPSTAGGAIGVSPLSFRYVRVTAGAAGVGNRTTLTISAK